MVFGYNSGLSITVPSLTELLGQRSSVQLEDVIQLELEPALVSGSQADVVKSAETVDDVFARDMMPAWLECERDEGRDVEPAKRRVAAR